MGLVGRDLLSTGTLTNCGDWKFKDCGDWKFKDDGHVTQLKKIFELGRENFTKNVTLNGSYC